MFEEFLQAILVHLNGADILFLLHVNVGNVQPHIAEIGCGLTHLSEYIAGFIDAAFVCQNGSNAVGCPDVLGVGFENLPKRVMY